MKNLILLFVLFTATIINAQTLSYNDMGTLLADDDLNGTARFNAMSGAFGALGGDLSAMDINPAGAAVFLNSEFSGTLEFRNTSITSSFYNNSNIIEDDYTNLSQAGAVMVFKNYSNNSEWQKFAIGFNYSMVKDFENYWLASGNSQYAPITDIYDPDIFYGITEEQTFSNLTEGQNNKFTFSFASQYNKNLYLGASITSYDVEYYQLALNEEFNNDGSGNTLDISQIQELATFGNGISFSFGFISKPSKEVRLGLAYTSPTWYELSEDFVEFDVELYYNNPNETITDFSGVNAFDYKLRTPSKLTGSFAYIFENKGLLSVDYTYKNYSNINLSNGNFIQENLDFSQNLDGTSELRIGGELKHEKISFRAGYKYQQTPYKNASDNINSFSLGAGYNFGSVKLDLAYQNSDYTTNYDFYPQYSEVNPASLKIDNSKVTATFIISM